MQLTLSDVFSIEGFTAYLCTKAGGNKDKATANSIATDLVEFYNVIHQSSHESVGKIDSLLNRSEVELFLDYIKRSYKPVAIWEILQSLKLAVQYTMSLVSTTDYYTRGCNVMKLLTDLQDNFQLQKANARRTPTTKWSCANTDHDCYYTVSQHICINCLENNMTT